MRKYFQVLETLPCIDNIYGKNLSPQKETFCFKSEAVASKFSREGTCGSLSAPKGDEKGRGPKCPEAARPDHGLLYTRLPAGFQASSLAQKSSLVTFK